MKVALLVAGVAAAVVAVVLLVGGGGDDKSQTDVLDKRFARERRFVERQVRAKRLPAVALEMFDSHNGIHPNFTGGPGDRDVLRVDSDGDGKPDRNLRFDLDHNGRIDADERRITERALYDAVVLMLQKPQLPGPGSDPARSS